MKHLITNTALCIYFANLGEYNYAWVFGLVAFYIVALAVRGKDV